MNLNYRPFRQEDLASMLRLWDLDSGWGPISEETWRQWYESTPLGPCCVVVAEDENGEIAGQFVLSPVRISAGGQLVRAHRMSAPILRRDLRTGTFSADDHPMRALLYKGFEVAAQDGSQVLFSLPHERWLRALGWLTGTEWGPISTSTFPCVARAVSQYSSSTVEGIRVARVTEFGEDYLALWDAARALLPIGCAAVREPSWLRWKNGGHLCLESRDAATKQLIGFIAIRRKDGLLVDGLARSPEGIRRVLSGTLRWLATEADAGIGQVKAMAHPVWEPSLRAAGFEPIDFRFLLMVLRIDRTLRPECVESREWYVLPGD